MKPWARIFSILALCHWLLACAPELQEPDSPSTWFPLKIGGVALRAQLALTDDEMSTGLMHRMELPPDAGMLFVYGAPGRRAFWMKNTHIPLDLGFFTSDGILREVKPLRPYDLTSVVSRRADIFMALEMNRGWFSASGLEPGARLDLELLREALARRQAESLLEVFVAQETGEASSEGRR